MSLTNAGIRAALGSLFTWKAGVLLAVILGSVLFYRPFCKWLCPLGAFYALLNKVSLFQMRADTNKCVSCGACAKWMSISRNRPIMRSVFAAACA